MAKINSEKLLRISKVTNLTAKGGAVLAPIVATATQFPVWIQTSPETTASGIALSSSFVIMALISAVPALKGLKNKLKNPTGFFMWGIFFAIIAGLRPIIDELYLITAVGFASNGGAFILCKLANFLQSKGNNDDANQIREFIKQGGI